MPEFLMPRRAPGLPLACLLAALLTAPAHAQPAQGALRPDPLDPRASVPPLRHTSSFAAYRRLIDEPAVPWRDANDTVGHIGGWRAYAREAQPTESGLSPAAAARPASAAEPARPPGRSPEHSGHHGHTSP